jgi:D-serine dehydratase
VYDIGLDNRTIADGLAVARASELVATAVGHEVTGAYTVSDAEMLQWMLRANELEGLRLEPSATAGLAGALQRVWESDLPRSLADRMLRSTHVVWATGGGQLPDSEFDAMLSSARAARHSLDR